MIAAGYNDPLPMRRAQPVNRSVWAYRSITGSYSPCMRRVEAIKLVEHSPIHTNRIGVKGRLYVGIDRLLAYGAGDDEITRRCFRRVLHSGRCRGILTNPPGPVRCTGITEEDETGHQVRMILERHLRGHAAVRPPGNDGFAPIWMPINQPLPDDRDIARRALRCQSSSLIARRTALPT